jgi:hypothetical protein
MNIAHTDRAGRIDRIVRRLEHQEKSLRPGMLISLARRYLALEHELGRYSAEVGGEPALGDIRGATFHWARGHRKALIDAIILCMKYSHRTPGVTEGEILQAIDLWIQSEAGRLVAA